MARFEIDKATVRDKLPTRREPYWGAPVERGLFVGFRRLDHGGNWIARCRTHDGRQVYQSLGPVTPANDFDTAKREARRWAKHVESGVKVDRTMTVGDFCRDYVEDMRQAGRARAALDTDKRCARIIHADPIGAIRADKLAQRHIEEWLTRMAAGKLAGRKTGIPSKATINRNLTTLKAALNRGVRRREIPQERTIEWASIAPHPNADGKREIYLDLAQRRALLAAAGPDLRDMLTCIALTGCRPGDPAVMLRKDYDARTATAKFRTKTGERTIPVSAAAKALFDRVAKGKLPNAHLFTNGGVPWTAQTRAVQVKAAAAEAGLPAGVVAYTLRHCWITDAIIGGMDVVTVAKISGTSLEMINQTYGHLVHDAARDKLAGIAFV
jgi:integrase